MPGPGWDRNFFLAGTGAGPGFQIFLLPRPELGRDQKFKMTGAEAGPGMAKLKMPRPGRDRIFFIAEAEGGPVKWSR